MATQLLIQHVRYGVLLKYLGKVLLVMAAFNVPPGLAAVALGEWGLAAAFAVGSAALAAAGWLLNRYLPEEELKFREAVVLAGVAYFLTALVVSLEWLAGAGLPFVDSFFDALSAITTTGLGLLPTARLSRAVIFCRSWLQWVGGLGIIILTLTVLIRSGRTALRVLAVSVGERISPSAVRTTKLLWWLYALLTAVCFLAYWGGGMGPFDALSNALSTLSTGGFATSGASMARVPSVAAGFVILFMLVGGTNLQRLYAGTLTEDPQLRLMLALVAVFSLMLFAVLWPLYTWYQALGHAIFQTVSAQTTTGFSTLNVRGLPPAAKYVLIAAMYVGGSLGSTAGGIKILRLLIIIKLVRLMTVRLLQPREVVSHLRVARETVGRDEIEQAVGIAFVFGAAVFVSVGFFVAWGYDPLDSTFDVVSAAGTVGLSTGITSPTLPLLHKGLLCLNMWMGRLDTLSFLLLVYPRTWVKWR